MTRYFGIQEGPFSGQINVGLLDRMNTEFLAGFDIFDVDVDGDGDLMPGMGDWLLQLRHEDCTDMAIRVVAEHVLKHYDGNLAINYNDGTAFTIQIQRTADAAPADRPAGESPHATDHAPTEGEPSR